MSIHTLSAAANELYNVFGKKVGAPTLYESWKRTLTNIELNLMNKAQNFGKHGRTDPDGTLPLFPRQAEIMMLDAVVIHAKVHGIMTPLMHCFYSRFSIENPALLNSIIAAPLRAQFLEAIEVYNLGDISRVDYLEEVLAALNAIPPKDLGV